MGEIVVYGATAPMILLCACVRYWPCRGANSCASVLKLVLFRSENRCCGTFHKGLICMGARAIAI